MGSGRLGEGINRVEVRALFGKYDYTLQEPDASLSDLDRMLVLYGDNGSGKTTILRILYHLLCQSSSRGHRTALTRFAFGHVSVAFATGLRLAADRLPGSLTGGFRMELSLGASVLASAAVETNEEGRVSSASAPHLDELYTKFSQQMPMDIYHIGDDRLLESDRFPRQVYQRSRLPHMSAFDVVNADLLREAERVEAQEELTLTLDRGLRWLREQVIHASAAGNQNSNVMYRDVLRRIAQPPLFDTKTAESLDSICQRLAELGTLNDEYERFGLIPRLDHQTILGFARNISSGQEGAFISVILPFLDGLEARLNALARVSNATDAYVNAINSFYADKQVTVSVGDGIRIVADSGDALAPGMLSSGERQLMLLLTNMLVVQEDSTLFIIDEPEISLNMKWQRQLVDALLATTRGSKTHFMLATHSFEVLAAARDRVIQLHRSDGSSGGAETRLDISDVDQ